MLKNTKFIAILEISLLLFSGLAFADDASAVKTQKPQAQEELSETDLRKVSEAFGHFIGRNLNTSGIKFDLDSIIKGMRDGATGKPSPMNDQEYENMMARLQETAFNHLADENLKAANDFLSKNAKETGIVVIEPGKLQYIMLQQGHDPAVGEHGSPLITYTGKYLDGTIFGSSEDVGGPITVPLDQTIPGFSKGLVGMKEGEKRRLFVHPDLGYGKSGHLPPNSLLIFDVEVVKATSPESDKLSSAEDLDDHDDENDDMDL